MSWKGTWRATEGEKGKNILPNPQKRNKRGKPKQTGIPTMNELTNLLLAGHPLVAGKYLLTEPQVSEWDDDNGKHQRFAKLRHRIMGANTIITIDEPCQPGIDPHNIQLPFKSGDQVFAIVQKMATEKGNVICRGELQVLKK